MAWIKTTQTHASPYGICGRQSDTGIGFSSELFSFFFHATGAPYSSTTDAIQS